MKFSIRQAQIVFGEKTFTDPERVELSWSHGEKGCLFIAKAGLGWKAYCKLARSAKSAFKAHLSK